MRVSCFRPNEPRRFPRSDCFRLNNRVTFDLQKKKKKTFDGNSPSKFAWFRSENGKTSKTFFKNRFYFLRYSHERSIWDSGFQPAVCGQPVARDVKESRRVGAYYNGRRGRRSMINNEKNIVVRDGGKFTKKKTLHQ